MGLVTRNDARPPNRWSAISGIGFCNRPEIRGVARVRIKCVPYSPIKGGDQSDGPLRGTKRILRRRPARGRISNRTLCESPKDSRRSGKGSHLLKRRRRPRSEIIDNTMEVTNSDTPCTVFHRWRNILPPDHLLNFKGAVKRRPLTAPSAI